MASPLFKISDNHRRGISAALAFLDAKLSDFAEIARGRQACGEMYREVNSLSAAQRGAVLSEVEAIRGIIRELRSALGLEPRCEDLASFIWGACMGLWETLIETEARYLRRYGEVPPDLAAYLDPRIEEVVRRLGRMAEAVHGEGAAMRSGDAISDTNQRPSSSLKPSKEEEKE
mgnify:CR=1 FL=1